MARVFILKIVTDLIIKTSVIFGSFYTPSIPKIVELK